MTNTIHAYLDVIIYAVCATGTSFRSEQSKNALCFKIGQGQAKQMLIIGEKNSV
jgi:hypothetical protein